jgi:general secretion pathway protein C
MVSLLLFLGVCALATYWVTTWMAMRTLPVPAQAQVVQPQSLETGAVRTLFGGTNRGASSNVRLLGVVSAGPRGAAILAVDGGEPQVVRAGGALADLVLVEVLPRRVVLERNGVRQELPLPDVGVR